MFLEKAQAVVDCICEWLGKISAIVFILMMLNVFFDVIMRYLFNDVSIGMQELEWHFFATLFLLGTPYTLLRSSWTQDLYQAPFRVTTRHLALTRRGKRYARSLRARAEIEVPEGRVVEETLSYRVRAFIDFLVDRFAGTPQWDRDCSAAMANDGELPAADEVAVPSTE